MVVDSFIKSVLKFSVSSWINFAIGLIAVTLGTRVFSPDVYGVLNVFNTTSGVLVGIACLGFDGGFLRFFHEPPKGWDQKKLFTHCLLMGIIGLFLISLAMLSFYELFTSYIFHKINFFFAVLLSVNALSFMVLNHFTSQLYRMREDAYHYSIQQILVQFFTKIFVLSAALIDPSVEVVLVMNTIGIFLLMLIYLWVQRKDVFSKLYAVPWRGFGAVAKYSLYYWPKMIVFYLDVFLLPFIITTVLGSYYLGIYASAGYFVAAFAVIQNGFRVYWASFMYKNYMNEKKLICAVHDYVIIAVILLLGLFIIFQHIVYLLIGQDFHESRLFFSLVVLDPLLMLVMQTTCYGTTLVKKNQQEAAIFILTMIFNAILAYVLTVEYGLLGAAGAVALTGIVRYLLSTWRGQKYYNSISNYFSSICAIMLLIFMAVSNVIFNNYYLMEVLIVMSIFFIVGLIYRQRINEVFLYLKVRTSKG